jgi:colanic acid biosynthesis protein WcaH
MTFIPAEEYSHIIQLLPIICVDIVIQNRAGEYLLVKRANEPLKNHWWVVGGRVLKGETLKEAAARKVKEETGLPVGKIIPIGYYEEVFNTNPFGVSTQFHTVSVVFHMQSEENAIVSLDCQSIGWKFTKELPVDFRIKPFDKPSEHRVSTLQQFRGGPDIQ